MIQVQPKSPTSLPTDGYTCSKLYEITFLEQTHISKTVGVCKKTKNLKLIRGFLKKILLFCKHSWGDIRKSFHDLVSLVKLFTKTRKGFLGGDFNASRKKVHMWCRRFSQTLLHTQVIVLVMICN